MTSQSKQRVSIPPEVLARYNSVNQTAEQAAQTPFQNYGGQFVAPINDTQQAGIAATNAAAGQAQPYFDQASSTLTGANSAATPFIYGASQGVTQAQQQGTAANDTAGGLYRAGLSAGVPLTLAGSQSVDPTNLDSTAINKYLSPYLSTVLGNTSALINQNNQQAMAGQTGSAIKSGAFGGDRAGIAAAALQGQQNLAAGNIYSGILNEGYNSALGTAQQQQGLTLSAEQANRARELAGGQQAYGMLTGTGSNVASLGNQQFTQGLNAATTQAGLGGQLYSQGANTATTLAGLGTGAQEAALQGAQARLGAGQLQQQTQQAQDTALYNQFLQEKSYPFQTAQFLANIAEGTGSLSGSTTTTTTPGGLFMSDERSKEHIETIGKTFDGQNIVKFRYKGSPHKQIGLIAQDVEKKHPDAVGLMPGGMKGVNYDLATKRAAKRGHFAYGGQAFQSNVVTPGLNPIDMQGLLEAQEKMYGPYASGGLYGNDPSGTPHGGKGWVPEANLPVSHLTVAGGLAPPTNTMDQLKQISELGNDAKSGVDQFKKWFPRSAAEPSDAGGFGEVPITTTDEEQTPTPWNRGGLVLSRAIGGEVNTDTPSDPYGVVPGSDRLNIPNTAPTAKLATAGNAPQSGSNSTLSDIASIAKLAALAFMNTGGVVPRKKYATAGAVDISELPDLTDTPENIAQREQAAQDQLDVLARAARAPSTPPTPTEKPWHQDYYAGLAPPARGAMVEDAITRAGGQPTSGYRTPQHNADVGGVSNSAHLNGAAGDFVPATGLSNDAVVANMRERGVPISQVLGPAYAVAHGERPHTHVTLNSTAPGVVPTQFAANDTSIPSAPYAVSALNARMDAAGPGLQDEPTPGLVLATPIPAQGSNAPDTTLGDAAKDTSSPTKQRSHDLLSRIADSVDSGTSSGGWADNLLKTQNLIPILTGIAAMAAAPTKYPFVALTQGLGAGAKTYAELQTQQAQLGLTGQETEIARQSAQSKSLGNLTQLYNVWQQNEALRGHMSFTDFARSAGYKGPVPPDMDKTAPTGAAAPTASTSAPTFTYSDDELNGSTTTADGTVIPNQNNPDYVRHWASAHAKQAQYAPAVAAQIARFNENIANMPAGMVRDASGALVPAPGALTTATTQANLTAKIDRGNDFVKTAQTFLAPGGYDQQMRNTTQLDDVYKNYIGGTGAQEIAGLAGLATRLGIADWLPKDWQNAKDGYDTANKAVANTIIAQMNDFAGKGAPEAAMDLMQHALAAPGLSAEARRMIVVRAKALLLQQHDMYAGFDIRHPEQSDDYRMRFTQTHPIDNYITQADKITPQYKTSSPVTMGANGPPANAKRPPGATHWDTKNQQFTDADGNLLGTGQ